MSATGESGLPDISLLSREQRTALVVRSFVNTLEARDQELAKLRQIVASYERDAKTSPAPTLGTILADDFCKLQMKTETLEEWATGQDKEHQLRLDALERRLGGGSFLDLANASARLEAIGNELGMHDEPGGSYALKRAATRLDQMEIIHVDGATKVKARLDEQGTTLDALGAALRTCSDRLEKVEKKLRPVRKARKAARK